MNRTIIPTVLICASLYCSESFALKQLIQVSPNATTFHLEPQKNGMVRFTIIRDPTDAREPLDRELILVRSAQLTLSDGKRTMLTVPIAPSVNDDGNLVYVFLVAEEHAPHAVFTISEIEDYRDRHRPGYMGGGTIYKYAMHLDSDLHKVLPELLDKNNDRSEVESKE